MHPAVRFIFENARLSDDAKLDIAFGADTWLAEKMKNATTASTTTSSIMELLVLCSQNFDGDEYCDQVYKRTCI